MIKDLDIWEQYKSTLEKLPKNDKVSKFTKRLDLQNIKIHRRPPLQIQDLKVGSLTKSEMKKFVSEKHIDLHGRTREIEGDLEAFCLDCIRQGLRFVTVITGKGNGILKSSAEAWFKQHPELITSFSGIKDSMMQVGSYAVKLRYIKRNR